MADNVVDEIRIADKGIHCAACEATIERFVSHLPGIEQVKASEKTQLVTVTFDPQQLAVDQVRDKLDELGYTTVR